MSFPTKMGAGQPEKKVLVEQAPSTELSNKQLTEPNLKHREKGLKLLSIAQMARFEIVIAMVTTRIHREIKNIDLS
jgi:hypothetical protein